ncbi:MAG TPA: DUF2306 domain-containing protein [Flavobacteriales bacterium]
MSQRISKTVIAFLAVVIGLYPGIYFILQDRTFGLLSTKSPELLADTFWNIGFYTHIIFGGIALLIGWLQFHQKLLRKKAALHRLIGKVYVVSVLLSALAGIGTGFTATGGLIASVGFICLGIIWFTTTLLAYLKIRASQIEQHRKLMIYSYAACFAAVTLRVWLPLLMIVSGDYLVAYLIVSWLCWVPNMEVANLIVKKLKPYNS